MTSTMERVAELAEVSVATVSRVINAPERVAQATRERVHAAMRQLGYSYNAIAGGLSRQRTMTIGLIVPTVTNPIFAESTRGVQQRASAHGYAVLIGITDYRADEEARLVQTFRQHRVDGLVVTSSHAESPALMEAQAAGTPVVLTYSSRLRSPLPCVGVDNAAASAGAVGALIRLGHRRVAMLAGHFDDSDRSHARYQGYLAALAAHGLAPDPALLVEVPYTLDDGIAGTNRLLEQPDPPTAIFCSNDILAFGAMRAALDRGLSVPADLSVIGFDDSPMAAASNPRLSTVSQPAYEMGARASDLLCALIDGEDPAERTILLPTELRLRDTTAPPRR
ncbi:MAG TPA: LacI family DNA-binding transcriptional regulator [Roseiflexaceae bacterium]|nr:LacI family DNA-binding transcriptional regulator [Roseiflexaceae bacterium]